MIRAVAAMDDHRGLANEHGLPWQGKVPLDVEHMHKLFEGQTLLMGYNTYKELAKPMDVAHNYVLTTSEEPLRPGFEAIHDLDTFLANAPDDLWILGGPNVFAQALDRIDELHITHIEGDFHCTKFFPPFEDKFNLVEESQSYTQNGITFKFTIYVRNNA